VLPIANIIEKMTKIIAFNHVGNSTPLYEEKLTIVVSNTITAVKTRMMVNAVFLLRVKDVELIIFPFTLLNMVDAHKCLSTRCLYCKIRLS